MATTDSDLTAPSHPVRREHDHGVPMDTPTRPSVRDLIAELAATEDVLRERRRTTGAPTASSDLAVRHRQREIVGELRRRHARLR